MTRSTSFLFVWVVAGWAAAAGAAPSPGPELSTPELAAPLAAAPSPAARKAQLLARARSPRPAAPDRARAVIVDCARGEKLQRAIDRSSGEVTIEIRGLCNENVRVERRKLTLHGLDPATDGIRGVVADPPATAALEIWYSELVHLENLSITHAGGVGLGLWFSGAEVRNCRMIANANNGVHVSLGSFLDGTELTISNNGRAGLNVQRSSLAFCLGCRLENNATWGAIASSGGLLSVLDGVITGSRGLQAVNGSYADIDCVSEETLYPCSLNVTRTAALTNADATVALYGAGPFAGQMIAFDRGEIDVYGAQQTSTGVNPAGHPLANSFEYFSTLVAEPYFDAAEVAHQSQILGPTQINTFSRALLIDGTAVNGNFSCTSAGDAWADAGVTVNGGAISGCEHVPPPVP